MPDIKFCAVNKEETPIDFEGFYLVINRSRNEEKKYVFIPLKKIDTFTIKNQFELIIETVGGRIEKLVLSKSALDGFLTAIHSINRST